jgi:hypothetical protein
MLIKTVELKEGYVWIRQGFWLFKQNPFTFLMLVFLYIFLVQLSMFIPLIGIIAMMILTPAISVGFMSACQMIIRKERVTPAIYLSAFKDYGAKVRANIFKLGSIYAVMVFVLSLIATQFVDFEKLIPLLTEQKLSSATMIKELYMAMIVGGCLYLPIAMLMWFSPMLVVYQNMSVSKALFGSWMACWMNRGAFLVYASIWAVILIATPMFLGTLFDALDLNEYASFFITPVSMAAITVLYCSFFATWKGCYQENSTIELK